jgi:Leucine-rich repeat (LRR) protein
VRPCFVLALACCTSAFAQDDAAEKAAIAAVEKAGGKATIDAKLPAAARVSAQFDRATDATFAALKKAHAVGAIDAFDATLCTSAGFAHLKDLPHLTKLALGKSNLSAACTKAVAECGQLRTLYVARSGLTDVELAPLKKLVLLEALDISENPQITDKGMATLKELERLRTLELGRTGITDKGLIELQALDGLRKLSVFETKVTEAAATKFVDVMPNLRTIKR